MVYGWDKDCERDPDWAAAVQADPHQPFYHVLPDEGQLDSSGDCLSMMRCYVLKSVCECGLQSGSESACLPSTGMGPCPAGFVAVDETWVAAAQMTASASLGQ